MTRALSLSKMLTNKSSVSYFILAGVLLVDPFELSKSVLAEDSFFLGALPVALAASVTPPRHVKWWQLRMQSGSEDNPPPSIKELDGALVKIAGFLVPLDDSGHNESEYLLVPSAVSCIHASIPPLSQIVHVKVMDGSGIRYVKWPVFLTGILHVKKVSSFYGSAVYTLNATATEPFER
jgi:hypothetical protein